jgi:hypothetical protein
MTEVPDVAEEAGENETLTEEQGLASSAYWLELYASQRPNWLPKTPTLAASRTHVEKTYVPLGLLAVLHVNVAVDE